MKRTIFISFLLLTLLTFSPAFAAGETLTYSGHVQDIGWMDYVPAGTQAGTTGQAKRIEALKIKLVGFPADSHIEYSPHVEDYGWRDYVSDDAVGGTTGEAKRVEAFKIRLTGSAAQNYDVYYRCHIADFGWLGWAKNDQVAGTSGYAKQMEAVIIQLVPKNGAAPGPTGSASIEKEKIDSGYTGLDNTTGISYSSFVHSQDWQNPVRSGAVSGTEGQALPVEAFKAKLDNLDGQVEYTTQTAGSDWLPPATNDQISGSPNSGNPLVAVKINLTGSIGLQYDIYYRTHVSNVGWLGWAKNGEPAGTTGTTSPMEAVQIMMVPKMGQAPSSTASAYKNLQKVTAIPGVRTVQNFIASALLSVGTSNYVFGGGWNEADNGAGPAAVHIGLYPQWKAFFDQQNAGYNYLNTKYQILNGLDCSGYVGWVVYNTLNNVSDGPGEVYWADDQARWYAQKGYGSYTPMGSPISFEPGDIMSLEDDAHVYICLGTCPDGSVLIAHSSPPGVMLTGLTPAKGQATQATTLAHTYMQRYYPEYYNRYSNQLDRTYDPYMTRVGKFVWSGNFVGDPDNIRSKSAQDVLKILFNE